MSVLINPVLPVTLADLAVPSDGLQTNVRIYLQDKRFEYYRQVMWDRHRIAIWRSESDDDIEKGIDGWTRAVGGEREAIQDKERFWDREGNPYMDIEYEYRRNINLPEDDYWHWGREWRNRRQAVKYYDLTTQDGMRRRFLMAQVNKIAEAAHKSVLEMDELYAAKRGLLEHGHGCLRRKGWELKGHTDKRGGHRKTLLYIRWYEDCGRKPLIEPIEEWKVN